jgi:hypothetical protein
MGDEIKAGDTCARCGQTIRRERTADALGIDTGSEMREWRLVCECLAGPTLDA